MAVGDTCFCRCVNCMHGMQGSALKCNLAAWWCLSASMSEMSEMFAIRPKTESPVQGGPIHWLLFLLPPTLSPELLVRHLWTVGNNWWHAMQNDGSKQTGKLLYVPERQSSSHLQHSWLCNLSSSLSSSFWLSVALAQGCQTHFCHGPRFRYRFA